MGATHYDAIIVGGGVIGCAIAYYMTQEGAKVLLLEQERVAAGASSAAAGMLGAQAELIESRPLLELALRSRSMFPAVAEQLKAWSGIDIGLQRKGLLRVARTAQEAAVLKAAAAEQQQLGEQADWLTPVEARHLEPHLSPDMQGALHIEEDGQVSAPDLTRAFAASAAALGADIEEYAEVQQLLVDRGRVQGVRLRDRTITSDKLVLAASIGAVELLRSIGIELPMFPVKGECVLVQTTHPLLAKTIYTHGCYLVPKKGGELLIGATVTPHTYDRKVSAGGVQHLIKQASELVPAVQDAEWKRAWAGLRPQTPHGLPYMGEHPQVKGLLLATGHYRNGILLSPITGVIMTELAAGKRATVDLSAFSVKDGVSECAAELVKGG